MTSRTNYPIPALTAALVEPWAAGMLAERHPDVFELVSDLNGIVGVKDLEEANKLEGSIELDADGEGLVLRVFGVDHALTIA